MSMTDTEVGGETAVRQYLLYLEDPNQLRDEAEIQKKTQAVLDAHDPIDKLKALSELKRAATIEDGPLRADFIKHAKPWAEENGVPVSAFRELQVADDVLREAGFDVSPTRARRGGGRTAGNTRQRAKAVSVGAIQAYVLDRAGTFLLSEIQAGVGGSPATVRKAVDELVERGQVEKLGPVPDWHGRGRAPVQYISR